jgi:hypothetical protein
MADQPVDVAEAVVAVDSTCVHRWRITASADEAAQGTCRLCGLTREFTNQRRAYGAHRAQPPRSAGSTPHQGDSHAP